MNIKEFAPKSAVLADIKEAATSYEGTFAELYSLVKDDKVTLMIDEDGEINGIWVNSDSTDPMVDAMSGMNFNVAYCDMPVMTWIDTILTLKKNGEIPTEITDTTMTVNGEVRNFDNTPYVELPEYDCEEECCDSSETMNIPYEELEGHEYDPAYIKAYIRYKTGRCFAKGTIKDIRIELNDDTQEVEVSHIQYGRKLTEYELDDIYENYLNA